MLYVTLLDQFHPGIYSSQVVDVCDHLNKRFNARIRLVAFLSLRELLKTNARRELKNISPGAIVLPAFPGLANFGLNIIPLFFICAFLRQRELICRHPFAARIGIRLRKMGVVRKVVYDGRSAISAECEEYNVFPLPSIKNRIRKLESDAVLLADFRIAVSHALVAYWQERFGYQSAAHVVIPCTLDSKAFPDHAGPDEEKRATFRGKLSFESNDVVMVYSGSTAPWQSFSLMELVIVPMLDAGLQYKVLFLSHSTPEIESLTRRYPRQVSNLRVRQLEILDYLSAADYGLLVREQSVTNQVASPVKFAEYLFAGLSVLISEQLGDFSEYVKRNDCGLVLNSESDVQIRERNAVGRKHAHALALADFRKEAASINNAYGMLMAEVRRPA